MKKILVVLVASLLMCFLYFYKSPILSVDEALIKTEQYLLNPSEEWGTILFNGLEGIPEEDIHIHLFDRTGFWNKLFNRMQWEVTIKAPEMNATIMIDAHNGKFIDLVGAFN